MVNIEPQISDSARYTVTEVAALLQLHRNTIRDLAESRMLKYKLSPRNGRKYFLGREIKRFWRTQVI